MGSSFRRPIIILRQNSTGSYVKGRWVEPDDLFEETILASVQPLTGREIDLVPQGRRNCDSAKLISESALKTVEVTNNSNPDIVVLNGERYEVHSVSEWQNNVLNHYEYVITKAVQ
jgi:Fe-S cluster assembly scaffold protein SufB